jgi:pimeloyl-ACP methyl ester carboxylesterase
MKRITLIKLGMLVVATFIALPNARAGCGGGDFSTTLVKYYETEYELPPASQRDETAESICNIRIEGSRRFCTVRLWGALHRPRPNPDLLFEKFPTLIFNHGSENPFKAFGKYCKVAQFFVPKGYVVFVPFRRGQGDPDSSEGNRVSSGKYIEDVLNDFVNNPSHHNTTCTTKACYKAQLLKLEADEEVDLAAHYLTVTADLVTQEADGDYKLAVGGNSYGGAVTVFFNRKNHGQKAVMAFAPAAQNWGNVDFEAAAAGWDLSLDRTTLLGTLLNAAKNAKQPAFYLQAKWDFDTRATIDLAYAHAYGSSDPTHGNRFMASIFTYQQFPPLKNGQPDYQSAHGGFSEATEEWGRSVRAFLIQYGVK